jgi:VRR-NUC domain-containing protein
MTTRKLPSFKILDKGAIRESALKELTWRGYNVWRQNNIAVRGRKFIGRLGVSDLIGITKDGRWVACEIKTINDFLSEDQKNFLNDVKKAGGISLIACQGPTGSVELKAW